MMNMFPSLKFSSQMLFHNISMESYLFPIYINGLIFVQRFIQGFKTINWYIFFEFINCQTFTRTILSAWNSIWFTIENCITDDAILRRQALFRFFQSNFVSFFNSILCLATMRTKNMSVFC